MDRRGHVAGAGKGRREGTFLGRARSRVAKAAMALGLLGSRSPDGARLLAQLGKSNVETQVAVGGTAVGAGAVMAAKGGCGLFGKAATVAAVEGGGVLVGKGAVGVAVEGAGARVLESGGAAALGDVGEAAAGRAARGLGGSAEARVARLPVVLDDELLQRAGRLVEGHPNLAPALEPRILDGVKRSLSARQLRVVTLRSGARCAPDDIAEAVGNFVQSVMEEVAEAGEAQSEEAREEAALRVLERRAQEPDYHLEFAAQTGAVALKLGVSCMVRGDARALLRAVR